MLKFRLDELMEEKKVTINRLSTETVISRPSLTGIYSNTSKGIQLETLEKLMKYFDCNVEDIIMETKKQIPLYISNLGIFKIDQTENNFFEISESEITTYSASEYRIKFKAFIITEKGKSIYFYLKIYPTKSDTKITGLQIELAPINNAQLDEFIKVIENTFKKLNPKRLVYLGFKLFHYWIDFFEQEDVENKLQKTFLITFTEKNDRLDKFEQTYPIFVKKNKKTGENYTHFSIKTEEFIEKKDEMNDKFSDNFVIKIL